MLDEKWQELIARIKSSFEVENEHSESIEDIPNGKIEEIVFITPQGKMKVIRKTMPRVLDKKTIYSKRAGSEMNVQYEYAEDELNSRIEIYRWDNLNESWVRAEISL